MYTAYNSTKSKSSFCISFDSSHLAFYVYFQVQIQGQQQGQMLGQVLQVPSGSHQQLQGVTTAQLIQPGELTEEQHQQVCVCPYACCEFCF